MSLATIRSSSTTRICALTMMLPSLLVGQFCERDAKFGAPAITKLDAAAQLLSQGLDQLHAQGFRVLAIDRALETYPIVGDDQREMMILRGAQLDADFPRPSAREGIFQRVGQEFIDEQTTGNGRIDVEED